MSGYAGKYLEVNLDKGEITTFAVDEWARKSFFGGAGLSAWIYFERFLPPADALSPENPLFLFTGPLTGAKLGGASRFAGFSRSPLTDILGYGSCGAEFGPELKFAGLDGILITGKAKGPVYLYVQDGKAEIRDAADLWGKDTFQVHDELRSRSDGDRKGEVACIGPAGEKLVRMAAISGGRADFLGRSGLGAVMGSKLLKAVHVVGTGKFQLADKDAFSKARRACVKQIKESVVGDSLKEMGTSANMDLGMMIGDIPIKNWSEGEGFELTAALGGPTIAETVQTGRHACGACPIACRGLVEVKDGPYPTDGEMPRPEFETLCAIGTQLKVAELAGVIRANEHANRLGMDTISLGNTIALAYDCYEQGILTKADTDGLELEWGNVDAAIELVKRTGLREGIGDLIAEGSRRMGKKLGAEHLTCEIKGLEVPMHDPRGAHGLGLAYMMSNRGACHMQHVVECVEHGVATWTEVGFLDDYDGQTSEGKAALVKLGEDFGVPFDSLCICQFDMWCYSADTFLDVLGAVTGWKFTLEEYLRVGARTWLLERALNNLLGVTRADDRCPKKIMDPLPDGGAAGSVPDVELMLKEYYEMRGLDQDGRPTREALRQVGLDRVAEALHGKGT